MEIRKYYYDPVNINQWNYFEKINSQNHEETFLATKKMKIGDIIFLHVGSQDNRYPSGIYAYAEVTSEPYIYSGSLQKKAIIIYLLILK